MRTMSEKKVGKWTRVSKGRGFTLAETLIVVALLGVIAAIAFMGVVRWRKTMKQLEYDTKAKEIFVAAQNHLTLAESQGLLEGNAFNYGKSYTATSAEGEGGELVEGAGDGSTDSTGIHYFVYNGTADSGTLLSVLDLLLPFGSIDENIRAGGSYIIRYQPDIAVVLDVFYTEDAKLYDADYAQLIGLRGDSDEAKDSRRNYMTTSSQDAIVGYYGGDTSGYAAVKLKAPTVQVQNGDTLKVVVTYPRANDNRLSRSAGDVELRLVIEELAFEELNTSGEGLDPTSLESGEEEGQELEGAAAATAARAQRFITLTKETPTATDSTNDIYEITLDDVTLSTGASKPTSLNNRVWGTGQTNDTDFVPGYNLKVYAKVQSTTSAERDNQRVFAIAKSNEVETNESFAQTARVEDSVLKVEISSFRHLANLSKAVSGFNGAGYKSVEASQTTDLSWGRFTKNISKEHEGDETQASATVVSSADGSATSQPGTFLPVNPSSNYVLVFDGLKNDPNATTTPTAHRISGVEVNAPGLAGIFGEFTGVSGTLTENSAIKNLVVVNAQVEATEATGITASAGALVGKLSGGATVSNVLVRTSLRTADASKGVKSFAVAGGLVGTVDNAKVIDSAAAVNVEAPGGTAGGLVGSAEDATIKRSYSSAHIQNDTGDYDKDQLDVDAKKSDDTTGSYAGGLVGSASSTTITSCYSTCAVGNASEVGGLVGSATDGSISGCYVTGLVTNPTTTIDNKEVFTGTVGTLIGARESGEGITITSLTGDEGNNYYYKVVNGSDVKPIGNEEQDEENPVVRPFDEMLYNKESGSWSAANALTTYFQASSPAVPYNQELARRYNGMYAFKTIDADSSDSSDFTDHLTRHYGDWPAYDVLIINK